MLAHQVLEQAPGLTYRQLDGWTRANYLHARQDGAGSGHSRHYTPAEVQIAVLMHRLHQAGLNVASAHQAARALAADKTTILAPGIELVLTQDGLADVT
ncbi:MerR family transcriptional regulator [Actinomadura rudentiformis]|uniref:MerR family transcriptional regulator n=1 Tax=Actinomadura rudentiformis TaxID=359158 RepID=UPI00178C6162|nr:MerR family transcriptional regulator [Actinomadura rudentiformis]